MIIGKGEVVGFIFFQINSLGMFVTKTSWNYQCVLLRHCEESIDLLGT